MSALSLRYLFFVLDGGCVRPLVVGTPCTNIKTSGTTARNSSGTPNTDGGNANLSNNGTPTPQCSSSVAALDREELSGANSLLKMTLRLIARDGEGHARVMGEALLLGVLWESEA